MPLHIGPPQYQGGFRFHYGTVVVGGLPNRESYFEHPIRWWFGFSFARMFVGIIRTEPTVETLE